VLLSIVSIDFNRVTIDRRITSSSKRLGGREEHHYAIPSDLERSCSAAREFGAARGSGASEIKEKNEKKIGEEDTTSGRFARAFRPTIVIRRGRREMP